MNELENHVSVRSFGAVPYEEHVKALINSGYVNTIFIDPAHSYHLNSDYTSFISWVRENYPRIVFVLFSGHRDIQRAKTENTQLRHYFHLEYFGPIKDNEMSFQEYNTNLDFVLRKCEEWHALQFQYDIALSFAGEDRHHAEQLAKLLREKKVSVFYDNFEKANLLGQDLYTRLFEIYAHRSRFCVLFASEAYVQKMWTMHERSAAQQRAMEERGGEYIIPIRIDNTSIPGLSKNIGFISIEEGLSEICNLLTQKLWPNLEPRQKQRLEWI